jgi:hypothetical protein
MMITVDVSSSSNRGKKSAGIRSLLSRPKINYIFIVVLLQQTKTKAEGRGNMSRFQLSCTTKPVKA